MPIRTWSSWFDLMRLDLATSWSGGMRLLGSISRPCTKRFTWMLRPSMAIRSNGIWWALWAQTTTKWWWWKRIWTLRRKRRSSLCTKMASQSFFMRPMWRVRHLQKHRSTSWRTRIYLKALPIMRHGKQRLTRLRINRLRMRWRFTRVREAKSMSARVQRPSVSTMI